MSKAFGDLALIDLVPSSVSGDQKFSAAADGAGGALTAAYQNIPLVRILPRIAELPEDVIELLGWQFHVDFWDTGLSLDRKRHLVETSIRLHRHKGTPGAVESVLRDVLGIPADILEWYQYSGEPYHFQVHVDVDAFRALDEPETKKMFYVVNRFKNTRSWLDGVYCTSRGGGDIQAAGGGVVTSWDRAQTPTTIRHPAAGAFQGAAMGSIAAGRALGRVANCLVHIGRHEVIPSGGSVGTVRDFSIAQ